MLFRQDILEGIGAGRVTLAFRRWRRAPPAVGTTLRTPVGVLRFEHVTEVEEGDITDEDLRQCGMSAQDLRASLSGEGALLRMEFRVIGADPRVALRDAHPDDAEIASIAARLARLDRVGDHPWTRQYLRLLADRPAAGSTELAQVVEIEQPVFKRRVRRLKELGLTESLAIGYRLSPRGHLVLDYLEEHSPNR